MNPVETCAPAASLISSRHRSTGRAGRRSGRRPGHAGSARSRPGVRHARRAGRHVMPAAAAHRLVQVVLDPHADGSGISSCWNDRATPRSRCAAQVRAALARALRVVVLGLVRPGAQPSPSRRARLLAPLRFFAALRGAAAALRGGLCPGHVFPRGGHRGVAAVARHVRSSRAICSRELTDLLLRCPQFLPQLTEPRHLRPQVRELRRLRQEPGDLLVTGSAASTTRAGSGISDTRRDRPLAGP